MDIVDHANLIEMKTFEEYLDKMGYSWNDFDRTYEMENLIEQYADERVKQALTIPAVVERSEELKAFNEQMSIDHPWYYSVPDEDIDNYVKNL